MFRHVEVNIALDLILVEHLEGHAEFIVDLCIQDHFFAHIAVVDVFLDDLLLVQRQIDKLISQLRSGLLRIRDLMIRVVFDTDRPRGSDRIHLHITDHPDVDPVPAVGVRTDHLHRNVGAYRRENC